MSPQVVAAIIAASVSFLTLIGTLAAQYFGRRATSRDTQKALEEQGKQLDRTLAEQRTRTLNERFATAAEQLGSDKPPAVRLAGVYAMAGLADDWEENRQTCVDVLCGYLRMPYEPDPGEETPAPERLAFQASREVRHTVIRVIAAHLKLETPASWQGLNFDFTGVIFDGGDLSGATFSGGHVSFHAATFSGSEVSFHGAKFSGGTVDFSDAKFSASVSFQAAEFSGGASFGGAEFSRGFISFWDAEFPGRPVSFSAAQFSGAEVSFNAKFSGGLVKLEGAEFSSGRVAFGGTFSGSTVGFGGARFFGSKVDFHGAKLSRGEVDFYGAEFSGGTVSFFDAEFCGSTVNFGLALFSGGTVSFHGAKFSGGTVDFSGAGDWSVPPTFPWTGTPPPGVILPKREDQSQA